MADQSVLRNLQEAGDDLTKARRVDHWFYFSTEMEMKACHEELIKLKFTTVASGINKETHLPYELHVWRVDHVDINTINPITTQLRVLAKKHHGEYDGWETAVEKE